MDEPDRDQIRAFLAVSIGQLSNDGLVSYAQQRVGQAEAPAWVLELACLDAAEILEAHHVLEKQLFRANVLPDSTELRSEIRSAVVEWAERVAGSGVVESDGVAPTVVRLFRLCPGYVLSDVSLPVEEFPYPPCDIQQAGELAEYIQLHLDELVPQTAA